MAKIAATVIGLAEFEAKLRAMGDAAPDAIAKALLHGASLILNDARQRAPVKTRTLSRSLELGVTEKTATGAAVEVGTNVPYARIHELGGTINHPGGTPYIPWGEGMGPFGGAVKFLRKDGGYPAGVQFTKPHLIKIPARPYLRPAFDAQQDATMEAMRKALARIVAKGGPS